jgi:DnaD/phage-associated family protein
LRKALCVWLEPYRCAIIMVKASANMFFGGMEVAFGINPQIWGGVFAVPSCIVKEHIKLCSGISLKLLLIILSSPEETITESKLAARLNIPSADISDALNYWIESGVLLSIADRSDKPKKNKIDKTVLSQSPANDFPKDTQKPNTPLAAVSRPNYARNELLSIVKNDPLIGTLVDEAQGVMGKVFTSADLESLIVLHLFYGLSAHYILTLLHYCAAIGKKSMGYAESVGVSWIGQEIDDDCVNNHVERLLQRRTFEGQVRSSFGLDRALTPKEKELIERWFFQFKFDLEMIMAAYEITIEKIGKVAFRYTDKILENWHKQGIHTPVQAKNHQQSFAGEDALGSKIFEKFMKQ